MTFVTHPASPMSLDARNRTLPSTAVSITMPVKSRTIASSLLDPASIRIRVKPQLVDVPLGRGEPGMCESLLKILAPDPVRNGQGCRRVAERVTRVVPLTGPVTCALQRLIEPVRAGRDYDEGKLPGLEGD